MYLKVFFFTVNGAKNTLFINTYLLKINQVGRFKRRTALVPNLMQIFSISIKFPIDV